MYKTHLFICTNGQLTDGTFKPGTCAQKGSESLLNEVKAYSREKFGKSVRVNKSGCLGKCEQGIACVFYPQNKWLVEVEGKDAETLKDHLDQLGSP